MIMKKRKFFGGTDIKRVLRRATTMASNRLSYNGNERKNYKYKPVTLAGQK